MIRSHRTISLLFAVALLAACTDGSDSPSVTNPTTEIPTTTTEAPAPKTSELSATTSDEPALMQLEWLVTVLNGEEELTIETIEARFSPTFLAAVPADQIIATTASLADLAQPPLTIQSFEPSADGLTGVAVLVGADGDGLSVQLAVASNTPHVIEGLGVAPTDLDFPELTDISAIDERLIELAPQSSLGVYNVTDGNCAAVYEVRTDASVPLGSVFKLWVLAALADEIAEGRARWDETMTVTDDLRSTPGGDIYALDTGTEVSLERLAEAMISISDNTATDLLMDRLGRETVEAAMVRAGVTDPAANTPMLSTGNLFALKFVAAAPNATDYRALDETGRRALLVELDRSTLPWVETEATLAELAEETNADGVPINEPRDLDIEWFATTGDLCRTLVHLDDLAQKPGLETVASILEINPGGGLPFDRDQWPTIRFKGGSEPGVVAGAWWFGGADAQRYVVAGGLADSTVALDELNAILTIASAIQLVE